MAYRFKKVKKTITLGANPGRKYVAAMAVDGRVTTDQLFEFVERDTSIDHADIEIMFGALSDAVEENVEMGRGVNVKTLGVFSPNFRAKGEVDKDSVSASNVEKIVVNFRPAREFQQQMKETPVEETTKFNLKHE